MARKKLTKDELRVGMCFKWFSNASKEVVYTLIVDVSETIITAREFYGSDSPLESFNNEIEIDQFIRWYEEDALTILPINIQT